MQLPFESRAVAGGVAALGYQLVDARLCLARGIDLAELGDNRNEAVAALDKLVVKVARLQRLSGALSASIASNSASVAASNA